MHRRKRCKCSKLYHTPSLMSDGALLGVFMVGGIAVIASIVRLYALWIYTITNEVLYDAIYVSSALVKDLNP